MNVASLSKHRGATLLDPLMLSATIGVTIWASKRASKLTGSRLGRAFWRAIKPRRRSRHARRLVSFSQLSVAELMARPDSAARVRASRMALTTQFALPSASHNTNLKAEYPTPLERAFYGITRELEAVR